MRRRTFVGVVGLAALSGCLQLENVPFVGGRSDDPSDGPPLSFRNATDTAGLDYENRSGGYHTIGGMTRAGVYVSDYDNDGREDLLAMGSEPPELFRNTGDGFEPSQDLPSLADTFDAALFFDRNNNGWDDLLLLGSGLEPRFLENDGGTFRDAAVGFETPLDVPIGAAAADSTGDGWPDLFVIQNGDWGARLPAGLDTLNVPTGGDNGTPNRFYRGSEEGFTDATADAGIAGARWSLATSFVDLDGDGLPDIHVANDFNRDVRYRNRGDGTFERREFGDRTNRNGMSSAVADITGNGRLDVFVTNIWYPSTVKEVSPATLQGRTDGNNLLVRDDAGGYTDRAESMGLERGGWGWAAAAVDFDNDTHRDLVHATQRMDFRDLRPQLSDAEIDELHEQYSFFRSPAVWHRGEEGFDRVDPAAAGFEPIDGRGIAHLDFDRDGRVDLVMTNAAGPYQVYENRGAAGRALQVEVRGTETTPALGARVTVAFGDTTLVDVRDSKTDFLSQSSRVLHFGVGDATTVDLSVRWRDGTAQSFEGVQPGRRIAVAPDGIEELVRFDR